MESQTLVQYDQILNQCRKVFSNKMQDYGTAWRDIRLGSFVDSILMKLPPREAD
jgi:hypothetical protein